MPPPLLLLLLHSTYTKLIVRHGGHTHSHRCAREQSASKGTDQHRCHWICGAQHSAQQACNYGQCRISRFAQPGDLKVLQYEDAIGAHHQATEEAHSAQTAIAQQCVDYAEHGQYGPQQGGQGVGGARSTCLAALQYALQKERERKKGVT